MGELHPICAKCRVSMRLAALEDVSGCGGQRASMSIYVCVECGRLAAFALPSVEGADQDQTAPAA